MHRAVAIAFGLALTSQARAQSCEVAILSVAFDDDNLVLPILHGPVDQRIDEEPRSVQDGDFLISAPGRGGSFAGTDESVSWVFNIGGEGFDDWLMVLSVGTPRPKLVSATLLLDFTPQNTGATNDLLAIHGLPPSAQPLRPWLLTGLSGAPTPNETYSIEVNLLDYYSAWDLGNALFHPTSGRLSMIYEDDALVESAMLDLVFDLCDVAEPIDTCN